MVHYQWMNWNSFLSLAVRKSPTINNAIENFPDNLKKAVVSPIYQCSVNTVFEKLMLSQILPFIRTSRSNLPCGFREGYIIQRALIDEAHRKLFVGQGDRNIVGRVAADLSNHMNARHMISLSLNLKRMAFR